MQETLEFLPLSIGSQRIWMDRWEEMHLGKSIRNRIFFTVNGICWWKEGPCRSFGIPSKCQHRQSGWWQRHLIGLLHKLGHGIQMLRACVTLVKHTWRIVCSTDCHNRDGYDCTGESAEDVAWIGTYSMGERVDSCMWRRVSSDLREASDIYAASVE